MPCDCSPVQNAALYDRPCCFPHLLVTKPRKGKTYTFTAKSPTQLEQQQVDELYNEAAAMIQRAFRIYVADKPLCAPIQEAMHMEQDKHEAAILIQSQFRRLADSRVSSNGASNARRSHCLR